MGAMPDTRTEPPAATNSFVPPVHPQGVQLTPWWDIDVTTRILNSFLVHVTPACAREWLKRDLRNRPRRPANAALIEQDMRDNNFGLTGDMITFSWSFLLSGGHRLDAVLRTGTTQTFFVAVGLPEQARHFTDQAARFSAADSMRFEGHVDPKNLAGLVGAIKRLEEAGQVRKRGGGTVKASNRAQLDFVEEHPEMRRILQVAQQVSRALSRRETSTVIGLCLWMFTRGEREHAGAAYEFWRNVETPAGVGEKDPAFQLFRKIMASDYQKTGVSEYARVGMCITAWNAWVMGKPLSRVGLWPEDKPLPEVLYPGPKYPARLGIPAPLPEDFPQQGQQTALDIVLRS